MPNRAEVYAAIDGERDYQNQIGLRSDGLPKSVGDYLTLLRVYSAKAEDAYANNRGNTAALKMIRMVAALAVQCMEVHGAERRHIPQVEAPCTNEAYGAAD